MPSPQAELPDLSIEVANILKAMKVIELKSNSVIFCDSNVFDMEQLARYPWPYDLADNVLIIGVDGPPVDIALFTREQLVKALEALDGELR